MSMLDDLRGLGVDVDDGLNRVMGDASMYEMILGMFVDSVRDNPVAPEDFDGADLEGLIKRVHTLKGVTGNLSITPLFKSYNQTLVLLREGSTAAAKKEFEGLLPVQAQILGCITGQKGA